MLDIDVTFLIQLVNLLITLVVVNHLLIRPVREILAKRRAARADLHQRITSLTDRASADADVYEKTLRTAREEGGRLRREARAAGLTRQGEMLAVAGREAAEFIRAERTRAEGESREAATVLSKQVNKLADAVANKLLA